MELPTQLIYTISVSPGQWVLVCCHAHSRVARIRVFSLCPVQAGGPLVSPEPSTGQYEPLWTHKGSTSTEEAEEWFCQGSSQREATCSNPELFNAKSPRKMFRKRSAVEIQFGSQKETNEDENATPANLWHGLNREEWPTSSRASSTGTLLSLNRNPVKFGTEQGRGLPQAQHRPSWAALRAGEGSR